MHYLGILHPNGVDSKAYRGDRSRSERSPGLNKMRFLNGVMGFMGSHVRWCVIKTISSALKKLIENHRVVCNIHRTKNT